jgi:hypothetical protein
VKNQSTAAPMIDAPSAARIVLQAEANDLSTEARIDRPDRTSSFMCS